MPKTRSTYHKHKTTTGRNHHEYVHVKPHPGMILRDPRDGEPLPEEGRKVKLDSYWRRRIKFNDVVRVDTTPKTTATKTYDSSITPTLED